MAEERKPHKPQVPGKAASSDALGGIDITPRRIAGLVIAIAALIFVFSNTGDATLQFLWIDLTAPAWLMLLVLLAAGTAIGFLMGRQRYKK